MTFEIIECSQNSDEWYRARMKIPTSSKFQCLLAKSTDRKGRAAYMRELAAEILTDERGESFTSAAMDRGHAMEQEACDHYAFLTDTEPQQVGFIRSGRKGGSPDSLVGANGLLEIKTQRADLLIETLLKNEFPSAHKAQCQGNLWISEREWIDICVFWPKMPVFIKRAYRDEHFIRGLAEEVDLFNEELDELVAKIRAYGGAREAA
jgi:hypothetical protein